MSCLGWSGRGGLNARPLRPRHVYPHWASIDFNSLGDLLIVSCGFQQLQNYPPPSNGGMLKQARVQFAGQHGRKQRREIPLRQLIMKRVLECPTIVGNRSGLGEPAGGAHLPLRQVRVGRMSRRWETGRPVPGPPLRWSVSMSQIPSALSVCALPLVI